MSPENVTPPHGTSELGRIHVRDEIVELARRQSRRAGVLLDAIHARTPVDAVRPYSVLCLHDMRVLPRDVRKARLAHLFRLARGGFEFLLRDLSKISLDDVPRHCFLLQAS